MAAAQGWGIARGIEVMERTEVSVAGRRAGSYNRYSWSGRRKVIYGERRDGVVVTRTEEVVSEAG